MLTALQPVLEGPIRLRKVLLADGILRRHPQLSLRKPEALSYGRAKSANAKVVKDFYAKLAAVVPA